MAAGDITSWEIGGETVETVSEFLLGGSENTADSDCKYIQPVHSEGDQP